MKYVQYIKKTELGGWNWFKEKLRNFYIMKDNKEGCVQENISRGDFNLKNTVNILDTSQERIRKWSWKVHIKEEMPN